MKNFQSKLFALLCFGLLSIPACVPEEETNPNCDGNHDFPCAQKVTDGSTVTGKIEVANEQDYYLIEFTEVGVLELKVDAVPAGTYMYVDVFDTNNDNSHVKSGEADSGESLIFDAGSLSIGKHYVRVRNYGGGFSTENYKLTFKIDARDKFEFNNSFPEAKSLAFGTTAVGTIRSNTDVDYFKFTNTVPGILEISLPEVPDGVYMYIDVFNTNNDNSHLASKEADSGQSINFAVGPFEPGEHYVRLRAYSNGNSADLYELKLDLNTTDANEINNSYSTATTVGLGQTTAATLYGPQDVDFYKVTTTQSGVLKVNVPQVPPGVYLYAQIYETNNDNSGAGGGDADSGEALTATSNVLPAGTHYVKVYAYSSNNSPEPYQITISQ